MSVLWNGSPTDTFHPSRGICQGESLSLYLFVLCKERLVHVIDDAVSQRLWQLVPIGRGGPKISNLMFADDLVLFAEATVEQAEVIKECLT